MGAGQLQRVVEQKVLVRLVVREQVHRLPEQRTQLQELRGLGGQQRAEVRPELRRRLRRALPAGR